MIAEVTGLVFQAEVDSLIEMVSRLKGEKEVYQAQVKRLHTFLKKSKQNGAIIHHSQPDDITGKAVIDLSHPQKLGVWSPDKLTIPYSPADHNTTDDAACQQLYQTLFPGHRGSRASTLTTYMSTTHEDFSPLDPLDYQPEQSQAHPGVRSCFKSPSQRTTQQDPLLVFDHVQDEEHNNQVVQYSENHNKMRGLELNSMLSSRAPPTHSPVSTLPHHINSINHPGRELRPKTLNLLDKSHVIPEYEEETSYIAHPSGVKYSQSCDAIIQRHQKLNFIIYI